HRKNNLPSPRTSPGSQNGWLDYLEKSIEPRGTLHAPLSRGYCGGDDASCRALIIAGLTKALTKARQTYGARWQDWRVPTLCASCEAIRFPSTDGGPPVDPIPWQNRGTYVEVTTGQLLPIDTAARGE